MTFVEGLRNYQSVKQYDKINCNYVLLLTVHNNTSLPLNIKSRKKIVGGKRWIKKNKS